MKTAAYWESMEGGVRCLLCPHRCRIPDGETGLCMVRRSNGGTLLAEGYGQLSALALDPIEKKPLRRFYPGSMILSVGSYGCNLRCPFCQNYRIAVEKPACRYLSPAELAALAAETRDNLGVAYTYNEPLTAYEYVLDCAKRVRAQGQKNVLVTNGTVCPEPLTELLPWIDAMNIDLKCFSEEGYHRLGGRLAPVQDSIRLAAGRCHVEVTTLVVPGLSDDEAQMEQLSAWLSSVDADIPFHVTRYRPCYRYTAPAPDAALVHRLAALARRHLRYVYI